MSVDIRGPNEPPPAAPRGGPAAPGSLIMPRTCKSFWRKMEEGAFVLFILLCNYT